MSPYLNVTGIVIKRRVQGDTDLQITLFTNNEGKINCLAKGATSFLSRRGAHLQIGNIIKATLFKKNDRYWISDASCQKAFLATNKNLIQLNLLFYFLEILNRILPENQINPQLYDTSINLISAIRNNHFHQYIENEIKFIKLLGFGPTNEICDSFNKNKLKLCQNLIRELIENVMERPLQSQKLFS